MIQTLAIRNYRSLRDIVVSLGAVNVVTGENGSGKSSLYRALRLLADAARGTIVGSLAREGGLASTLWAGPEKVSAAMRRGEQPVQGGPRREPVQLRMGFGADSLSYCIDLGLPPPPQKPITDEPSAFHLDPEIKRECIFAGARFRPASLLVDRHGPLIKVRNAEGDWGVVEKTIPTFESMLTRVADTQRAPEVLTMRETIRSWRFYDHFRVDSDAPVRQSQLGTRTPVLSNEGHDLAAALQTIKEIGDIGALNRTLADAFPGSALEIEHGNGHFSVALKQPGMLRGLKAAELSDGTLRFLLWIAALLTPRPPPLMVLNEPETSLHPDLLPALARLIRAASKHSQLWVISHSARLIAALESGEECRTMRLTKNVGETFIEGQDRPSWDWPAR
jgi:predicted ATPase